VRPTRRNTDERMKGGSHLMTPMICWSALLTGLYRDCRELFTESGPFFFFFVAQVSCVY